MSSAIRWKRVAYSLGMALTAVSVAYVLYQIYDERIWEVSYEVLARLAGATLLGIVLYALGSLLLVLAWHKELGWAGERPPSLARSLGIYGRAQLAKYAPGNVFSLVGRQVLGRQSGLSHKGLAWASMLEVLGMLYAAGLLACAGASHWASSTLGIPTAVFFVWVAGIACLPFFLVSLLRRWEVTRRFALPEMAAADYLRLNLLFLIYVPFFALSGLLFAMLLRTLDPGIEINWFAIVGTVSAIWLIGYITPGASAGIGVRDALLLLAVGDLLDSNLATLVVVAYRVLTIVGDIGFFGLALLVRLPAEAQGAHSH